jgi:hypothetical protein
VALSRARTWTKVAAERELSGEFQNDSSLRPAWLKTIGGANMKLPFIVDAYRVALFSTFFASLAVVGDARSASSTSFITSAPISVAEQSKVIAANDTKKWHCNVNCSTEGTFQCKEVYETRQGRNETTACADAERGARSKVPLGCQTTNCSSKGKSDSRGGWSCTAVCSSRDICQPVDGEADKEGENEKPACDAALKQAHSRLPNYCRTKVCNFKY